MQPRLTAQITCATSAATSASEVVPFGVLTSAVSSQSGRDSGTRFWKKEGPVAPFGYRWRRTGRPCIARINGASTQQNVVQIWANHFVLRNGDVTNEQKGSSCIYLGSRTYGVASDAVSCVSVPPISIPDASPPRSTSSCWCVIGPAGDARIRQVLDAARAAGVPVVRQPGNSLDRLAEGEAHQGVVAFVTGAAYADPNDLVGSAGPDALFVVLDGVEDPRNLGAIVRVAAAAGAHGLFLPERGAVGLTPVAVKAAAGAVERLPVARVKNVVSLLKSLKDRNIWVVGLDSAGDSAWTSFDLTSPVALVLGGEGRGLRPPRVSSDVAVGRRGRGAL